MLLSPKILEVNTRIWIKQFGENAGLRDVPDDFIEELSYKGINIFWLMGIWMTSKSLVEKCCFGIDLVPGYIKALSDWKREDVIGSPFAIDDYKINPALGTEDDLKNFRSKLNKKGIKLILDFVPNHLGADSVLLDSHPEIFLQADKETYLKDKYTFFEYQNKNYYYIAHGRDPFFPPWSDTSQLNFFETKTREFLIEKLKYISTVADGVRCDMAMLPLNNVFHNTWLGILNKSGYKKPDEEFWKIAISEVKYKNTEFIFIAEAYWDLEWELQQLGFDFTYDKRLTDRLAGNDISDIKAHLNADPEFQKKSVRFLENHDEDRAITKFGKYKSLAAAVVISTLPGARFYYDGQFEGRKIKLPVQLGREPTEKIIRQVKNYYETILSITRDEIFTKGEWRLLYAEPVSAANNSFENFLAWEWHLNDELRIVIVNYTFHSSQCRIKLEFKTERTELRFDDLLSNDSYTRLTQELKNPGLFVELKGYQSHIFSVKL
jgi:Alpha amylase, catalytic domain